MSRASTPDLIVTAARLHDLAGGASSAAAAAADALAVAAGRILAVGSRAEIEALAGDATQRVDLPGGTIVPAFVDAHAHPVMSLEMARGADLQGLSTRAEVVDALRRAAAETAGDEWLFAWGLDPNSFEGEPISNAVLHEAVGADRLAYVSLFDAHSAIASDALLERAGVTGARSYPDGSTIVADESGRPTGHLLEFSAMKEVQDHLPELTLDDRARALHELLASMAAFGIGTVHVMDMRAADTFELLAATEALGPLPVRLRISPWCEAPTTDAEVDELIALQGRSGGRWSVEGIKLFIDGTVEGGTAWLDTPDSEGQGLTGFWHEPEAYAARIARFHEAGVPTATHAIGERGIRFVAETLAALPPSPKGRVQHRIEHIESVAKDVVDLIGANGIAASMQPTHCTHYTRADGSDEWSQRLGPERAHRAWCTRDVVDAGAVLALGSDYPVAPYNPFEIMADAQLRRPAGRFEAAPVLPEQGLTAAEALAGYTIQAAASIGAPAGTGTLAVGELASFTVLDVDPLAVDADVLATARALLTVSEGIVTHRA